MSTDNGDKTPFPKPPLGGAREGGLGAPTRHAIDWQNPDFYNQEALDEELRRVFDVCHGCRRCFNLCDSFPRLFEMVDASPTGELDGVDSSAFGAVVEACTLCDMCYQAKCPYVPPHPFNIDFPHLMLRYRTIAFNESGSPLSLRVLSDTDTLGKVGSAVAPVANWAGRVDNKLTRPVMEWAFGVDQQAVVPKFCGKTLLSRWAELKKSHPSNVDGAWRDSKVLIYATCHGNYNNPEVGEAFYKVLAHMGATVECRYEGCCGMPKFEQGDLPSVAARARHVSEALSSWIQEGYTIVPLVPSCTLMMAKEWPLLLPEDPAVARLAQATQDMAPFLMATIASKGIDPVMPGIDKVAGKRAIVHIACHARALNVGSKAWDLLKVLPNLDVEKIERCSGHGGSWGFMKPNFPLAMKVGKPVMQKVAAKEPDFFASECPLALEHLQQGVQLLRKEANSEDSQDSEPLTKVSHPIQLLAMAYGL